MLYGINHQIIPRADLDAWYRFLGAIKGWVNLIRLDTHMDAYAWRVPYTADLLNSAALIGRETLNRNIQIDYIRDGFPKSLDWQALGGDWSSLTADGDWRNDVLPKVVWGKTNAWISAFAQALKFANPNIRWQGPNEQFNRGKDVHSFERMVNVYGQASYGKKWTSPALWGSQYALPQVVEEFFTLKKFVRQLSKVEYLAVNVYPDYESGVTTRIGHNVTRMWQNLVAVVGASRGRLPIDVTEFGFDIAQAGMDAELQVLLDAFAYEMGEILNLHSMSLFWTHAPGPYHISEEHLDWLGRIVKARPFKGKVSALIAELDMHATTEGMKKVLTSYLPEVAKLKPVVV